MGGGGGVDKGHINLLHPKALTASPGESHEILLKRQISLPIARNPTFRAELMRVCKGLLVVVQDARAGSNSRPFRDHILVLPILGFVYQVFHAGDAG